ncbi:FtsL-like putative cell division protein [Segatella copri]|uniref:FtsL-like putative cell division protein n=1 Tax=Segatella copri TaxID=165179 RepID=UPI001F3394A1|nr:FtsL-like putative cell division protein [Segatella copri]MCW4072411.1 FtsL-like putative cell division protein [Segatella copri]
MINDKDIKTTEKPITDEKAQASQEPPKQETPKQETPKEEPQQQEAPQASLKEVLAKQAIEEEASGSSSFTLRKILGGDILTAQIIRRQIWLVILIVFFVIIYISNRYNIQNDIIELDKLQKELQDTKYKALSTSSQITEKSRESNVLDMLKNNKDSVLHIATQPPYIINIPEE